MHSNALIITSKLLTNGIMFIGLHQNVFCMPGMFSGPLTEAALHVPSVLATYLEQGLCDLPQRTIFGGFHEHVKCIFVAQS